MHFFRKQTQFFKDAIIGETDKYEAYIQRLCNRNDGDGLQTLNKLLWNRDEVEDQELIKFDLKVAQFKAMEVEVKEGRRAIEDLEQLKIELDEM